MGVLAAAAIGAAGTIGGALINASNQPSAPQLPNFSGIPLPKGVNVWKQMRKAVDYNATDGASNALTIARRSNTQAVSDLETAMGKLFGGASDFNAQRSQTNTAIEDELSGKLSASTEDQLGRHLLDSGVTNLGPGAASNAYVGFLGNTVEGLQQQGQGNYRSLYSMYRQALPLSTGMDAMRYTTMDPGQVVQLQQGENMNHFNAQMALRGAQYQVGYNGAVLNASAIRSQNMANTQLVSSVGQGAGAVLGAYNQQQGGQFYGMSYQPSPYYNYQAATGGYNPFTGAGTPAPGMANVPEGI